MTSTNIAYQLSEKDKTNRLHLHARIFWQQAVEKKQIYTLICRKDKENTYIFENRIGNIKLHISFDEFDVLVNSGEISVIDYGYPCDAALEHLIKHRRQERNRMISESYPLNNDVFARSFLSEAMTR